jgi:hypothetical protein
MIAAFPSRRATWLSRRVLSEPHVERINLSWFSQLGDELRPLVMDLYTVDEAVGRQQLALIRPTLGALLDVSAATSPFPLPLRSSRAALQELINLIATVLDSQDTTEFERQRANIWLKAGEVRTVLNAELAIAPTYIIFRSGRIIQRCSF